MDYTQLSFFNTVHLTGEELSTNEAKAKSLEGEVVKIFDNHYNGIGWSADEMHRDFFPHKREGSVRRALSNLAFWSKPENQLEYGWKKPFKVVKCEKAEMIDGPYGVRVHRYKLIY